jgi:hypothetical protein
LNIGPEMIHLMELPNPDKFGERPEHGGRDRHFCIGLDPGAIEPLMARLDKHGANVFLHSSCYISGIVRLNSAVV